MDLDYDKIKQRISEKLIVCPVCGKNSFILDSHLYSPIEIDECYIFKKNRVGNFL